MALQLASILDQAALRETWSEQTERAMNDALDQISVQPGYRIMVTLADRSYLITSGAKRGPGDGARLHIKRLGPGPQTTKGLAACQCRLVIEVAAFEGKIDLEDSKELLQKRLMRIEGDNMKALALERDLDPHFTKVVQAVEKNGPSSSAIEQAIAMHNAEIDESKAFEKQNFDYELAIMGENASQEIALMNPELEPLFGKVRGWLLFSASTTMHGNMGQANYAAANGVLDAMTFSERTTRTSMEALTVMWGAVSNLGMRWKAFASADFLLAADNSDDIMLNPFEAQMVLACMFSGQSPEWVTCTPRVPDERGYMQYMVAKAMETHGAEGLDRHPDCWGWRKGKGGGLTLGESSVPAAAAPVFNGKLASVAEDVANDFKLFKGRRVRIVGLVGKAELNGTKGTLVEEAGLGKWQVRLDGDNENKLLKVSNMESTDTDGHALALKDGGASGEFCLAGAWNDWVPQDMSWDDSRECFTLEVEVTKGKTGFSIGRGKAGKRWKTHRQDWSTGAEGRHEITLFVKESGTVKKVEWKRLRDLKVVQPKVEVQPVG